MTHYDQLIDSLVEEIYLVWANHEVWEEKEAKETAHRMLMMVEEFQQKRSLKAWRASD